MPERNSNPNPQEPSNAAGAQFLFNSCDATGKGELPFKDFLSSLPLFRNYPLPEFALTVSVTKGLGFRV